MERLTYRTNNNKIVAIKGNGCNYSSQSFGCDVNEGREKLRVALEKLAAYEEAEEQGVLVRLPRKVGDTVYTLSYRYECKNDYDCKVFQKWKCEENIPCEYEKKEYFVKKSQFCITMLNSLGKTVFLTCEEAEKALDGENKKGVEQNG